MRPDDYRPLQETLVHPVPGKAFWIVWSPGGSTPPRVLHPHLEAAQQAAEQMARTHRGQEFYVMKAQSLSVVDGVKTTNLE